jgi:hypothetical protein
MPHYTKLTSMDRASTEESKPFVDDEEQLDQPAQNASPRRKATTERLLSLNALLMLLLALGLLMNWRVFSRYPPSQECFDGKHRLPVNVNGGLKTSQISFSSHRSSGSSGRSTVLST